VKRQDAKAPSQRLLGPDARDHAPGAHLPGIARNRLQKPRPEDGMNRKRGIDDLAGKTIVLRRGFRHLGALALNWNGTIITRN
jgi:hypothetical protein